MPAPESLPQLRQVAQFVVVAMLAVGCWLVLRPFFSALLFAAVIAVSTWPSYKWLRTRFGGRRSLASVVCCLLVVLAMVGPAALLTVSLVDGVAALLDLASDLFASGAPPAPAWLREMPWGERFAVYWDQAALRMLEIDVLLERIAEPARDFAFVTGRALGTGLLQVIIAVFLLFFLYRDGDELAAHLRLAAHSLGGRTGTALLRTAQNTVLGVMLGLVGTALAQAMVATLGFAIAGVPVPFLLGAATFVASMVPIGPPMIWGGAAVWLFAQGDVGWAVFMALYGFFGISSVDNVIKPFLISRTSHLPFALSLLGVAGGVIAFGVMGLFLGPTLLALAISLSLQWLAPAPQAPDPEPAAPTAPARTE